MLRGDPKNFSEDDELVKFTRSARPLEVPKRLKGVSVVMDYATNSGLSFTQVICQGTTLKEKNSFALCLLLPVNHANEALLVCSLAAMSQPAVQLTTDK